jgi:S1-C subfamily serine protease
MKQIFLTAFSGAESTSTTRRPKIYRAAAGRVTRQRANLRPNGSGTGFAISADGYVATCNHVIADARAIRIKGINGDFNKAHVAKVVARDSEKDLAILKVEGVAISRVPYTLGAVQSEVGEEVFVLGYPQTQRLGEELKLTTGVISSRSGYRGDITTYQISAQVLPGNSGCPLLDNEGRIIGVVNAKYIEPNVSYAVKLPYLRTLIERTQISLRQPFGRC